MKKYTWLILLVLLAGCQEPKSKKERSPEKSVNTPLITHVYTADPSAHVFNGKLYIYPSHDIESEVPQDNNGSHFNMRDYRVFSMDSIPGKVTDHGVVLDVDDVTWAEKQMWAPDATEKDGTYYLYFPAKDAQGIFKIGVATSNRPEGPFIPESNPIPGSYSIDPAVFKDDDGSYYMYFGGIMGGQLQRWASGEYVEEDSYPGDSNAALNPKMAKLSENMLTFEEPPMDVIILDKDRKPIKTGDHDKRFFEAAWMHKYQGTYYFSYSTGDTHKIVYATANNPYGPFTYQGVVLNPVIGWTSHHSIVNYNNQWYLFYHDSELSDGKTHLRSVKVSPLHHDDNGNIITINPLPKP